MKLHTIGINLGKTVFLLATKRRTVHSEWPSPGCNRHVQCYTAFDEPVVHPQN
jgi:hypothetical protein